MLELRLSEGHPAKLRELLSAFEAAGFASEAAEARARLPQVAEAFLAARLAEGDYLGLREAVIAAEAEGLSCDGPREELLKLVRITSLSRKDAFGLKGKRGE